MEQHMKGLVARADALQVGRTGRSVPGTCLYTFTPSNTEYNCSLLFPLLCSLFSCSLVLCSLQEEAHVMQMAGSPELIERVERLTLELAERIAIESYDVGEHLFEIMDDMHPVLRASTYRGVVLVVVGGVGW